MFEYDAIRFKSPCGSRGGFLLSSTIQRNVSTVVSPRNGNTFVRKRLSYDKKNSVDHLPQEVRFSCLGPVPFPKLPYLPEMIVQEKIARDAFVILIRYYNAGSLEAYLEPFYKPRTAVKAHDEGIIPILPEIFIWHVTEQICRAFEFLRYGRWDLHDLRPTNWKPILHRDCAWNNIFVHFPREADASQERLSRGQLPTETIPVEYESRWIAGQDTKNGERKGYVSERDFDAEFPQIIVGDLGMANRIDDPQNVNTGGCFDQSHRPLAECGWEDIALLGEVMKQLVFTRIHGVDLTDDGFAYDSTIERSRDDLKEAGYSDELLDAVSKFDMKDGQKGTYADNFEDLPSLDWVLGELLNMAIDKVSEYKLARGHEIKNDLSRYKPYSDGNLPLRPDIHEDNKENRRQMSRLVGYREDEYEFVKVVFDSEPRCSRLEDQPSWDGTNFESIDQRKAFSEKEELFKSRGLDRDKEHELGIKLVAQHVKRLFQDKLDELDSKKDTVVTREDLSSLHAAINERLLEELDSGESSASEETESQDEDEVDNNGPASGHAEGQVKRKHESDAAKDDAKRLKSTSLTVFGTE